MFPGPEFSAGWLQYVAVVALCRAVRSVVLTVCPERFFSRGPDSFPQQRAQPDEEIQFEYFPSCGKFFLYGPVPLSRQLAAPGRPLCTRFRER